MSSALSTLWYGPDSVVLTSVRAASSVWSTEPECEVGRRHHG